MKKIDSFAWAIATTLLLAGPVAAQNNSLGLTSVPKGLLQENIATTVAAGDPVSSFINQSANIENSTLLDGSINLGFPIRVPAEMSGLKPDISIGYDSHSGNGVISRGWSLRGHSSVHRCYRTFAQKEPHIGIRFANTDQFCLDGNPLVLIGGTYGANLSEYATLIDSGQKITLVLDGVNIKYFSVLDREGTTREYGSSEDSRQKVPNSTQFKAWHLSRLIDRNGNGIQYSYQSEGESGALYLKDIKFASNSNTGEAARYAMTFNYEDRADKVQRFIHGGGETITKRLRNVEVAYGGLAFRRYGLSYVQAGASNRSELQAVQECSPSGECLPAHLLSYKTSAVEPSLAASDAKTQPGIQGAGDQRWLIDINGDGLPDYVVKTNDDKIHWSLNTGSGWGTMQTQSGVHGIGLTRWLIDINGDGLPDYVVKTADNQQIHWNLNTRTGWGPNQTQANVHGPGDGVRWLVDIDGDGLPDYVVKTNDGNIHWNRNTGGSWGPNQSQAGMNGLLFDRWLADINGDGLPDYVAKTDDNRIHWNLNTGSGWGPIQSQANVHGPSHARWLVDLDGDGLPDYVAKSNDGNIHWNRNTGSGWEANQTAPSAGAGSERWLVDINGDGLVDYVVKTDDDKIHINLGTGTGFAPTVTAAIQIGLHTQRWLVDLNGDGVPEYVAKAADDKIYWVNNRGSLSGLLTSVTSVLGATTSFKYSTSQDPTLHKPEQAGGYPLAASEAAIPLVSEITSADGLGGKRTLKVAYTGSKVDLSRKIWLGFRSVSITDVVRRVRSDYELNDAFPLHGSAKSRKLVVLPNQAGSGATLAQSAERVVESEQSTFTAQEKAGSYRVLLQETQSQRFGETGEIIASRQARLEYDRYGNITRKEVLHGDGMRERADITYSNDESVWLIGLPTEIRSFSTNRSGRSVHHTTEYQYDSNGNVLQSTLDRGTKFELQTQNEYSQGGRLTSTTRSVPGFPSRKEGFQYDQNGFLSAVTNSIQQTRNLKVDPRWGRPTEETAINKQVTTYKYDAFGRMSEIQQSNGARSTVSYQYAPTERVAFKELFWYSYKGRGVIERDILGRVIRELSEMQPEKYVVIETAYDSLGRLHRKTDPYLQGDTPVWHRFGYDQLSRETEHELPSGLTLRSQYEGLARSDFEGDRLVSRSRFDQRGLLSELEKPTGFFTKYERDPRGNLVRTTASDGFSSERVVDQNGNVIARFDSAGGKTEYAWNAFGELMSVTPAAGPMVKYDRDGIGRVTEEIRGPQKIRYFYDTANNGVGQLAKIEVNGAQAEALSYDARGLIQAHTLSIGATAYKFEYEYDDAARIKTITYPISAYKVQYDYASTGYLDSIRDVQANKQIWRALARLPDGRVSREEFANGLNEELGANRVTGRADSLRIKNRLGSEVINLKYSHDGRGNISSKADVSVDLREDYWYDDVGQLIKAVGKGPTALPAGSMSLDYGPRGDLKNLGGRYRFEFGSTGKFKYLPVAAIEASQDNNPLGPSKKLPYKYRDDGAVLDDGIRRVTYDPQGQIQKIQHNRAEIDPQLSGVTTTTYGVDWRQDIASIEKVVQTGDAPSPSDLRYSATFVRPLLEVWTAGEITELRHRIFAGSDLVVIVNHIFKGTHRTDGTKVAATSSDAAVIRDIGNKTLTEMLTVHKDIAGSIIGLGDENGELVYRVHFDPLGTPKLIGGRMRALSIPWTFQGFVGEDHDFELGLIHMRHRVYDPTRGRFLSPDPILAEQEGPPTLARYSYAGNNSLRFRDTEGLYVDRRGREFHGPANPNPRAREYADKKAWREGKPGVHGYDRPAPPRAREQVSRAPRAKPEPRPQVRQHQPPMEKGLETPFLDPLDLIGGGLTKLAVSGGKIAAKAGSYIVGRAGPLLSRVGAGAATEGVVAAEKAIVREGIYDFTSSYGTKYVGQSKDIPRRLEEHVRTGLLVDRSSIQMTEVLGGKTSREIAEQIRVDQLGGIENLRNTRNPIGPARWHLLEQ